MLTLCAWCQQEGIATVLTPGDATVVSHGICPRHAREFQVQIDALHEDRALAGVPVDA